MGYPMRKDELGRKPDKIREPENVEIPIHNQSPISYSVSSSKFPTIVCAIRSLEAKKMGNPILDSGWLASARWGSNAKKRYS